MNLKPKYFWSLTWFDWSVYLIKIIRKHEKEKSNEESKWARWRILVADYRNTNRGKNDPIIKPSDIIELSFDKTLKESDKVEVISFKEAKAKLGSKFKMNGVQ